MLTQSQLDIVKATVPLLEAGGEALTTHFYRILLAEHRDLRPLFNQAHQVSGAQPRALANGVLMYARHIDRLDALGPLAAQIIQKHVSLQVLPAHYPVVGACLLRAIREVLGAEVATEAVITAWGVAYGRLADLLMEAEEQAYQASASALGGWRGARAFRVTHKVIESLEIVSFHLYPIDGLPVMRHQPGQYIGLRLVMDGQEHRRNYSISSAPDGRELRISVKREPGGLVSSFLHDRVDVGCVLDVFPPAGHFVLQPIRRPVVFISGGVGITPTMPMLEQALQSGQPICFVHCARNREVHAFRHTVDVLAQGNAQLRRFYCYDDPSDAARWGDAQGPLDASRLSQWLPPTRDFDAYFLGPLPFMVMVRRTLLALGLPQSRVHFEFFGPAAMLS